MEIIALANQKGGVAKTTSTYKISVGLGLRPCRVPCPLLKGEEDRVSGGGVFRRAGECERTPQSRYAL